jgi:L-asparaginase
MGWISKLPSSVIGLHGKTVAIKTGDGDLLESAIPKVPILKDGSYYDDEPLAGPDTQVDIAAWLDDCLKNAPLAGFAVEGLSPYGKPATPAHQGTAAGDIQRIAGGILRARQHRGVRGAHEPVHRRRESRRDQGSDSADGLLMKFGALPAAADPRNPTPAETAATAEKVAAYQAVFDTH